MKYNINKRRPMYLLFVRSKNKTCYLNKQHHQCTINSYQLRKYTKLKEILRTCSSLRGGGSIDFVVPYLGDAIIAFPKAFQQNEQACNKSYCDIKPFSINTSSNQDKAITVYLICLLCAVNICLLPRQCQMQPSWCYFHTD